jgi:FMN reductase [NAD(P)H]
MGIASAASVEFRELLKHRRMVRSYRPDPVPRDVLERIVATVRRAPSAGFSQGQRFVVVTDPEIRRQIASDEDERVAAGFEPWLSIAPAHVLVCTREADYHDRYRREDKLVEGEEIEWPVPYWHVDAGASLMLILLAAIDEGLAAGVYGVQADDQARIRDLLGVPAEITIVCGVTLGYAAPDPQWSAATSRATQRRRKLDELVHWERWSS